MPDTRPQPVPVAVVTGFLGAGKSTFLLHLARRYGGRRIAWVVNEFSRLDVDGPWLRGEGLEVTPAPGGSLFCACLASTFRRVMGGLADRAAEGTLDGIVVETSGLTRPGPVDTMLDEFGLGDRLTVSSLTTLADAATLPVACDALEAAALQIAASDHIVLNKCDTASEEQIARARALITRLAPGRPIHLTARAAADLDPLVPVRGRHDAPGTWAAAADAGVSVVCLERAGTVDARALLSALEAAGTTLLRAKGIMNTPEGALKLDWDGARIACQTLPAPSEAPGLVLFPRPGQEGPAQNLLRRLHRGEFDPAAGNGTAGHPANR
ncbi:MAG TPA: GTP-binding protein [Candidatus Hydrogenedentes bacterium]|nr:GTP-binding protein [Candidatus Hydrogenedentota bacterium]